MSSTASERTWRKQRDELEHEIAEAREQRRLVSGLGIVPRDLPRSCLVLIVDDEASVRSLVSRIAREEGLEPVEACDVAGAIEALSSACDLRRAIVDRRLEVGTADTLLATLRHRGIDTLLLTAHPEEAITEINLDGVVVMSKPVPTRALREWMRRRAPQAEPSPED